MVLFFYTRRWQYLLRQNYFNAYAKLKVGATIHVIRVNYYIC